MDDLLQPSLQPGDYQSANYRPRPWRSSSLLYVAFFGGPAAVTMLGAFNARRLHAGDVAKRIIAVGLLTMIASAIGLEVALQHSVPASVVRLLGRGVALLLYLYVAADLKTPDRVFRKSHDDEDYASLWIPGILGSLVIGTAHAVLVGSIVAMWRT